MLKWRRRRFNSYTAYSIACFVVWGVLLLLVATRRSRETQHTLLLVFGGWSLGWLSATIARSVYRR